MTDCSNDLRPARIFDKRNTLSSVAMTIAPGPSIHVKKALSFVQALASLYDRAMYLLGNPKLS